VDELRAAVIYLEMSLGTTSDKLQNCYCADVHTAFILYSY